MDMIHEDHNAPANLPQEKIMKDFPKCRYLEEDINDTYQKIDDNSDYNVDKLKRYKSKEKY